MGYALLGYPKDPAFDRVSQFLSPGPPLSGQEPGACLWRTVLTGYYGFSEMVDLGDQLSFTTTDGDRILLERDPALHHRPAGESWYVGYGSTLQPVIQGHELLPENRRSAETLTLSFPGTILPPDSTLGAIPYPVTDATLYFPTSIDGVSIQGVPLRAPHHGYNKKGVWTGEDDDVRHPGPWDSPLSITWTPSPTAEPVTIALRYLGRGEESACCFDSDCEIGFSCEDSYCRADEGSGLDVVGELVCTVADNGEYTLQASALAELESHIDPSKIRGAVLAVGRVAEGEIQVPDALTWTGKRVVLSPVRTRVLDLLYTRLQLSETEASP